MYAVRAKETRGNNCLGADHVDPMYVIAQNRERDYAAVSNTGERKGCSGVKERGNDDLEQ